MMAEGISMCDSAKPTVLSTLRKRVASNQEQISPRAQLADGLMWRNLERHTYSVNWMNSSTNSALIFRNRFISTMSFTHLQ